MKVEELRALTLAVKEMSKDNIALANTVKTASTEVGAAKKLWKSENKPRLVKAGIALILLPEPFTTVIGTVLVAAGTVQEGIKRQAVYIEDIPKAFQSVMKELRATEEVM